MLSLNSYGLEKGNQVHLPRLNVQLHESSGAHSVSKLAQQRRNIHPLFQTTGFDYGRVVDFQDVGLHLSPLKRPLARHMTFTNGFIQGPFTDSSLGSLEMKNKRLILSDRLKEERKLRTKEKFEEKQLQLTYKREIRRELREKRRLEMNEKNAAATTIQRHIRGFLTRLHLQQEQLYIQNEAARRIQIFCRSKMQIYHAKQLLLQIKQQQWHDAANVLQHHIRNYLERKAAKKELQSRRHAREQRRIEIVRKAENARNDAVIAIQKTIRGFLARIKFRTQKLLCNRSIGPISRERDPIKQQRKNKTNSKLATIAPKPPKKRGGRNEVGFARHMSSSEILIPEL
ncbi:hypothetical protein THRCLA_09123 [Thraustotheca clavata]|uniref:Uncharacterized protein n=1 Tax=Thraustotheca clavata TaxID=74557 RepID=A0A1V9YZP7_9STRA|nr:hypothetical protein THRCLA_09123 [Thraustotheca clavata]